MEEKRKLKPYHGLIASVIVILYLMFGSSFVGRLFGMWATVAGEIIIAAVAVVFILIRRSSFKEAFPMKLPPVKAFLGTVALYIGLITANTPISLWLQKIIPNYADRDIAIDSVITSISPALAILMIAVFPAICEELFCRGFLIDSLKPIKSKALVIIITGLIFGVMHLDLYAFISTTAAGMLFAYLAIKTQSLILPILFHFVNNSISVFATYFIKKAETDAAEASAMSTDALIGYTVLMAGVALAFLYFGNMPFTEKRIKTRNAVTVFVVASIFTTVGYFLFLSASADAVILQNESHQYNYKDQYEHSYNVYITKKGVYSVMADARGTERVYVVLSDSEGNVINNNEYPSSALEYYGELEQGKYTITVHCEKTSKEGTVWLDFAVVYYKKNYKPIDTGSAAKIICV